MARRWPVAPALLAATILVASVVALTHTFSVSCPPGVACVTLRELEAGAELPEANRIYDRNGRLLAEVGGPLRRSLSSDEIPPLLAEAFVAIEDRRFWEHGGVDSRGVLRAAFRNVREREIAEGASTIPMQLVRTLWAESLRDMGKWRRKVIEARTAPDLIDELGRERVLSLYLNAIYLGNGIYGVERASRYYFGVGVDSISLGQIATLVGMTRSPERYEPRRHPERAREVRDVVLSSLAEAGVVPAASAEAAMAEELDVAPLDSVDPAIQHRSHLTAAVDRELRRLAPSLMGASGLSIRTTIDTAIQQAGELALLQQLEDIEAGRFGALGEDVHEPLEGAAVALDARTSAIRAWVGGREFGRSEFDRVAQSRRQVGSLVKPFLIALAMERGDGIIDVISSDTIPIRSGDDLWLPADHVPEYQLPMREALVRSSNRAAAHLGMSVGLDAVVDMGRRVGLSEAVPALPSSSIGAFDVSLIEMTQAFTVFGNGGRLAEPHLVTRVEDGTGAVVWERDTPAPPARVLDPATAFVILDAMRAVVDRGTGTSVRGFGYRGPAAGKTGTSDDVRDAWFVGLTPELVSGVWVGFDTPRPIVEGRGGGSLAAPAWAAWMRGLQGRIPQSRAWIPPRGVERVRYDAESGSVMGPLCRQPENATLREAWVLSGRYARTNCERGGVRGLFDRVWRALTPNDVEMRSVGPRARRRGPGG